MQTNILGDNQYVSNKEEFNAFINEDAADPRQDIYDTLRLSPGNEEPYDGYDILKADNFVGDIDTDKVDYEDSYDGYIGAEIALPDANRKSLWVKL